MPVYTFRGTNRTGNVVSGERVAANKTELAAMLRREQVNVSKMSEKGREFNIPTFGTGVDAKELAVFTRQFSVMIDAGLPLVQCLEILANQQENKTFQKVLTGVRASVEGGATLSASLKQYDKVFDALYYNMVDAGETGGILDTILQRLSTYIEKNVQVEARRAIGFDLSDGRYQHRGHGHHLCLLWKVVPIFVTLFNGLGAELPLPTRIVIGLSQFIGSWYGFLLFVVFVGIGERPWRGGTRRRKVAWLIDTVILKVPSHRHAAAQDRCGALYAHARHA